MLPFAVSIKPGESPYKQIVHAATKAILAGELAQGSAFPSVRELSQSLKINPNTAQKVVAELTRERLLEVRPGIGTIVAAVGGRRASATDRKTLLSGDVEALVVDARRLGLRKQEVIDAIANTWDELFGGDARAVAR